MLTTRLCCDSIQLRRKSKKSREEVLFMTDSKKDLENVKRIFDIFTDISKEGQIMAITYLSALRDKEILDRDKQPQEA